MSDKCPDKLPLIHRAVDDDLTPAEKAELWRHFAACAPCRREYERLTRALAVFAAAPAAQPRADFAARVMRRVAEARAAHSHRRAAWARTAGGFVVGAAAALAAVWTGVVAPTAAGFGVNLAKLALKVGARGGIWVKSLAEAARPFEKVAAALTEAGSRGLLDALRSFTPLYGAALLGVLLLFLYQRSRRKAAAHHTLTI